MPFGRLGFHTNCGVNKRYLLVKVFDQPFSYWAKVTLKIKNLKLKGFWRFSTQWLYPYNGCIRVSG